MAEVQPVPLQNFVNDADNRAMPNRLLLAKVNSIAGLTTHGGGNTTRAAIRSHLRESLEDKKWNVYGKNDLVVASIRSHDSQDDILRAEITEVLDQEITWAMGPRPAGVEPRLHNHPGFQWQIFKPLDADKFIIANLSFLFGDD